MLLSDDFPQKVLELIWSSNHIPPSCSSVTFVLPPPLLTRTEQANKQREANRVHGNKFSSTTDMAQASSWPLEGADGTEFGLIPSPELPPVLLPAWAVEGTIGITVPAVMRATEQEPGRKSSEAEDAAQLWGQSGGAGGVSLLSMPGLSPDGSGGQAGPCRWWPCSTAGQRCPRTNAVCSYWKLDCGGARMLFLWKCPGAVNEGRGKQKGC